MLRDGESLGSRPQVKRVFENALRQVMSLTAAERSVILFGEGSEEPKVRACSGFPADNFWLTAPLSLSLLKRVCQTGEPVEVSDVEQTPALQSELSLALANVRSLVCAPIWSARGNVAGLIYVDWVGKVSSAKQRILPRLQEVARQLEQFLRRVESGDKDVGDPFAQTAAQPALRTVSSSPAVAPISRRKRVFAVPDARSRSVFFRSLATMFGAGLPLAQSLYTLSQGGGRMGLVSEELARRLERGQSLAAAVADLQVFPDLVVSTLKVGERSGRLHLSLERLAQLEEDGQRRRAQLQAAMVYPAFVLTGCMAFLIFAPVAMLTAQEKMLSQLHVQLPWVTQAMLFVYNLLVKPWVWLPLLLLAVGFLKGAGRRRLLASWVLKLAHRVGPLHQILQSYRLANWTQLMALQLQSGLTVLDCLSEEPATRQRLMDGEEFWQALRHQGYPRVLCEMVRSGEETGRVPEMLNWLSQYFAEDFQNRLDVLTRLLEPLIMAVLGIVAGILLVATLLPMSQALQAL